MEEVSSGAGIVAGTAVSGAPETVPSSVDSLEARVSSLKQGESASGQPKGPEAAPPVNQPQEIAPEVSGDPSFLKAYGEAYAEAKAKSPDGSVDEEEVKRQALERYEKTKAESPENQIHEAVGERVKALEQKIDALTSQNEQLSGGLQAAKEQLLQVASSLNAIMPAISELVQNAHANEKNPQKKEHWAQILLKLLAVASLAIFTEGAKATNPIGGNR